MNSTDAFKISGSNVIQTNFKNYENDLLDQISQICECTGCSNDAAATALYDSHYSIELAIDKILENTQKINNDWHEVAKTRKKPTTTETIVLEPEPEKDLDDKPLNIKPNRGRGRNRNIRSNRNMEPKLSNKDDINAEWSNSKPVITRGRGGRRPIYRNNSGRNKSKQKTTPEENFNVKLDIQADKGFEEKWPTCEEWSDDVQKYSENDKHIDDFISKELSCNMNGALDLNKSNEDQFELKMDHHEKCSDTTPTIIHHTITNDQQSAEIVAKSSSKDEIFGDYSRTKPPPPSTMCLSDPVKLITSNGTTTKPEYNFSFGFDFNEYSSVKPSGDKSLHNNQNDQKSFINKVIKSSNDDDLVSSNDDSINCRKISGSSKHTDTTMDNIFNSTNSPSPSNTNIATTTGSVQINLSEKINDVPTTGFNMKQKSSIPNNHEISGDGGNNTMANIPMNPILSNSQIFPPPPGMSNQHLVTHGTYLSLLNMQNGAVNATGNSLFQQNITHELTDNQVSHDNSNDLSRSASNTTSVTANIKSQKPQQAPSQQQQQQPSQTNSPYESKSNQNICTINSNMPTTTVTNLNKSTMEQTDIQASISDNNIVSQQSIVQQSQHQHISHLPVNFLMPQNMLMNNFMSPQIHMGGGCGPNNDLVQSTASSPPMVTTVVSGANVPKQLFNMPPRNYSTNNDDYVTTNDSSNNRFDELMQTKSTHKHHRSQQSYGSNYNKDDSVNHDQSDKVGSKMNAGSNNQSRSGGNTTGPNSNQPSNRGVNQQSMQPVVTAMSASMAPPQPTNDTRRISAAAYFNPSTTHPQFSNNIYPGPPPLSGHHGPPGPQSHLHHHHHHHPYAPNMSSQTGGMQPNFQAQLHMVQPQLHNFTQPYQLPNMYSEQLMNTMLSNSNNQRNPMSQPNPNMSGGNVSGMNAVNSNSQSNNQSRSRGNNTVWHG